ncbi:MAG: tail fiber domain-containing protein [Phycisphaerae bacterium]|nr:tail fiber domain-containing protein [Phycisphaerae bacterium]
MGTAFNYQGQLKNAGSPLTDLADFQFSLWDAAGAGNPPSGGNQIGSLMSVDNVDVVDGLFTVNIDFGSGAFDGQARWLQIAVRSPAGSGAFTTLSPRQPLSPVPHALVALNAGQWENSGTAIINTNTGFVGINRDYTVGLEWFGVHAPVNSGYGGMYVTTEGAAGWPFYGYKAGNQAAWTYLDGNTGDWHVNVDGNKLTVRDEGFVGIRTTMPAYPLHVVSTNTDRTIHGENSTSAGAALRGLATHSTGSNFGVYGETASTSGTAVFGTAVASSGQTYGGRFNSDSPGGTGVDAGGGFIGVAGSAWSSAGTTWGGLFQIQGPSGAGVRGLSNSSSGTGYGVWGSSASAGGVGVYGTNSSTGSGAYGVLGELTNTSSTGAGVHGVSHYYGVSGLSTGSGGVGVEGRAENGPGVGVSGVGRGFGVMGVTSDPAFSAGIGVLGLSGVTDSGIGVSGISYSTTGTPRGVEGHVNSAIGYAGYFTGGRNYFEGRVGCGTLTPANPLSVAGDADITGRVSIGVTGADARLLVRGTAGEDAFRVRVDTASKLVVKDNGGVAIGSNFGTVPANGMRIAGAVGIGADPSAFTLVSNGDAAKPGGGSWSNFSDARLKRDIQPIAPGMLDRLLSLHGRTFEYVEDAIENRLGLPGRQTGLIAQEVREAFPEWVGADDEGYLYITERGLTAIVVEALRELRAEKDEAIADLKSDNDELRRRIERLETSLCRQADQRNGAPR